MKNRKIDVAIQSYKKPESLIYTIFSLKKHCGELIDTIYINDDCSGDGTIDFYKDKEFLKRIEPIKIKIRENTKASGYTYTLVTREMWHNKNFIEKLQLLGHFIINRAKFYKNSNDVRYQWAFNSTDKKYLFLIHDDIKFYDDILNYYYSIIDKDENIAIVGDLGGSQRCPFGPCGQECSPQKIMDGSIPNKIWPLTGKNSFFLTLLGRYKRNCRINEWCCLINVDISKKIFDKYGVYFGNYEGGGDVGTFWFDKIIKDGYRFVDPLPCKENRKKYYLHWWQGNEGHSVWVGTAKYEKNLVLKSLLEEYNYVINKEKRL